MRPSWEPGVSTGMQRHGGANRTTEPKKNEEQPKQPPQTTEVEDRWLQYRDRLTQPVKQ